MSDKDVVRRKVLDSVETRQLFDETEAAIIEWNIDNIVKEARRGKYKRFTVDKAPLRTKYFFGEGYTYGGQLQERGAGNEKLYPRGEVDPIPDWIQELVIRPVEEAGMVRPGWINSAVVNDYLPGGCIVSHIDPLQLFSRPIITVSFFSDSYLSFGCKFSFKPIRVSPPRARVSVRRGYSLSMTGYAANEITHCVRPEDIQRRRAVIILRHVPDTAPRMSQEDMEHFTRVEDRKRRERGKSLSPVRERRLNSPSSRAKNVFIFDHRKMKLRNQHERHYRERERSRSPRYRARSRSKSPRYRARSRSRSPRYRARSRSKSPRYRARSRSRSPRYRTRSRSRSPRYRTRIRSGSPRPDSKIRRRTRSRTSKTQKRISGLSSRMVDRILTSGNKKITVSKTVQDAILKNIMGQYDHDDDHDEHDNHDSSGDETVEDAVSMITNTKELDQEESAFQNRLEKMKTKIADEVKAGKHGRVKIEDKEKIPTKGLKEQQNLENEVQSLKNELKELKEHIRSKNIPSASSSSSSEDTDHDEGAGDEDDESDEEEEGDKPVSILDIFKTTILKKSKTTKSTYLCKDSKNMSLKKSKLIESKTRKILKERIQMRNKSKM